MTAIPKVFVSATSQDLATARKSAAQALLTIGCMPVEQSQFPPDWRSIVEMLRSKIADCQAVVHIAGFRYGAEPAERPAGAPRRSFTQLEYDIACELGKPIFLFLPHESYPFDRASAPEDEERQQLQRLHRQAIATGATLYTPLQGDDDLRLKLRELQVLVEDLRASLAVARRRLTRLRVGIAFGVVVGVLAALALLWNVRRLEAQTDESRRLLMEVSLATNRGDARANKLSARERYDLALDDVAFQNHIDPAELRERLENWSQQVERDSSATAMDRALSAFQRQRFAEATIIAVEAAALAQERARDLLTLAGQSEYELGHYLAAQRQFEKALALTDPAAEPERRADLLFKTTDAMGRGGELQRVRPLLDEALRLCERMYGPSHADTARALQSIGDLLILAGETAAAESFLTRALAIYEALFLQPDRRLASALRSMGTLHVTSGREVEGERLFERARGIDQAPMAQATALDHAEDLMCLATLHVTGNHPSPELPARRALEWAREHLGPDHGFTADCMTMLAFALHKSGRLDEAESEYRRALSTYERSCGVEHPNSATVRLTLGSLQWQRGRMVEAEPLLRSAAAALETAVGMASPTCALARRTLGEFLVESDRTDEAIELHRAALSVFERSPDMRSAEATVLEDLALLADRAELDTDIEVFFQRARQLRLQCDDPQSLALAQLDERYAEYLDQRGRWQAAEPLYREAIAIRERKLGAEHKSLSGLLSRLADALIYTGGPIEEVELLLERSVRIVERTQGSSADAVRALVTLGERLLRARRPHDALWSLERALCIAEGASPSDPAQIRSRMCAVAGVLIDIGRAAEARDRLQALFEREAARAGRDSPELLELVGKLSQAQVASGRRDDAEALLRRALAIAAAHESVAARAAAECYGQLAALLESTGEPEEVRALHLRAARAMVKAHRQTKLSFWEARELGRHYLRAELPMDALLWLRRAYDEAEDLFGSQLAESALYLPAVAESLQKLRRPKLASVVYKHTLAVLSNRLSPDDDRYGELEKTTQAYRACLRETGMTDEEIDQAAREAWLAPLPTEPFSPELARIFESRWRDE